MFPLRLFKLFNLFTVIPCLLAIPHNVSPFLTVYVLLDDFLDEPFLFFNPKYRAIPFTCPSAILFRNASDLSLSASDFVSINPFSVNTAGILVCRNTAKLAFLRPRLRQPVDLTTSRLIER